jgi:hypothetical protein
MKIATSDTQKVQLCPPHASLGGWLASRWMDFPLPRHVGKTKNDLSPTPHREGLQSELSSRTIFIVRALIGCAVSETM